MSKNEKRNMVIGVVFLIVGVWFIFFNPFPQNPCPHEPVFDFHPIAGGLWALLGGAFFLLSCRKNVPEFEKKR